MMRGDARLLTAQQTSARHGENTASSTVAQSWERVSMLQFLHGLNTPQRIQYLNLNPRVYCYHSVHLLLSLSLHISFK
jgi:uncharacterized protein YcaQ